MTTNSGIRWPKQIKGLLDYIYIDLGTGDLRMAYSIEGGEDCREIGNYPGAQAGTPSLVSQAPTNIIYEPNGDEPAKPVAFGYTKPRRRQKLVSGVKIALLPDPESYGYAYAALVDAADDLHLRSVQQILEDFLRFAIEHAIKECGGQQPTKGWVFSVPQYYKIEEVQNFRALIQRAGCLGNIHIHGESDCVAYANLSTIEDIISDAKESVFKKKQNYTIAVGIFDLGAGTTDITTSEICFKHDGGPPAINELSAPLGFAIGGDSFDGRFIDLLRAKLDINMTPDKEHAFFNAFVNHFHLQSKPQWTTDFEDEEYPFSVPYGKDQFVLTEEDMTYIMEPPIDEICRRVGEHLAQIIRPLDLVVISGGNSEVPGMVNKLCAMLKGKNIINDDEKVIHLVGQSLNAVVHGLHYWINHPQLVRGRYACMTLARVVKRHRKELAERIKVPAEDAKLPKFYDCAERIMTEGILVPDGIQTVDIYFDIDINAKNLNLLPIDICIPNRDAETYTSKTGLWNFASECRTIGALHLKSTITNIDIGALRKVATKGLRRLWLRLSIEVDIDINVVVSWRPDGRKLKEDTEFCSTKLTLESVNLSGQRLVNEFRAPIQQRESPNSNITNDTLPSYLQMLKAVGGMKTHSNNLFSTSIPPH
ncbi:3b1c5d94-71da-4aaa-ad5b-e1f54b981972 [Sclerotinia trifoliorum]|uniref:3b1c5d94-71da-4aaa-ad5b-e1f54b981972 n=1 Tax=Sclerotinia trifoliorum TaxID=28548 RepID=A0A8H2VQ02_9HELO|nr:3b1c5d94-71da-4aaa-ad5b-e1f54b981972 [Sclerotinia trifoliorum]